MKTRNTRNTVYQLQLEALHRESDELQRCAFQPNRIHAVKRLRKSRAIPSYNLHFQRLNFGDECVNYFIAYFCVLVVQIIYFMVRFSVTFDYLIYLHDWNILFLAISNYVIAHNICFVYGLGVFTAIICVIYFLHNYLKVRDNVLIGILNRFIVWINKLQVYNNQIIENFRSVVAKFIKFNEWVLDCCKRLILKRIGVFMGK